ncbi:hypothetical protein ACFY4K_16425 [Streptomyces leeuwenhoekii]|uniref:hypothetical protein n=1 Tax=Streptomyces leeuwenhoekii TaxID=1437453 RepID=UPI0036A470B0
MNNWQKDAQPERPVAATPYQQHPESRRDEDVARAWQAAPAGDARRARPDAPRAGIAPQAAPHAHAIPEDPERTAVLRLPGTPGAAEAVLPRPRRAPDVEQTAVLRPQRPAGTGGAPDPRLATGGPGAGPADATDVPPPAVRTHAPPPTGGFPQQRGQAVTHAFPQQAGALPEAQPLPEARPFPAAGRPARSSEPGASAPTAAAPTAPAPATPGTAPARDPWRGGGAAGPAEHAYDPHEVTVQLDAVQLGDGLLRPAQGGPGGAPEGSDGPVFVDESGRRVRRFRRLGIAVGIACAVYAAVMAATLLSGSSEAPWLPMQDPKQKQPAGQVEPAPPPSGAEQPAATGDAVAPDPAPPVTDAATPPPGSGTVVPGAAPATPRPDDTAAPAPATTRTTPEPGAGTGEPGRSGTNGRRSDGTPGSSPAKRGLPTTAPGAATGGLPGTRTAAAVPNDPFHRLAASGAPTAPAPSPEYPL